jgi:hypothetical protein
VPFLDAKALDTDPDGMAFLRAVIRPHFEQEEAAQPPLRMETRPSEAAKARADGAKDPVRSEAATVLPVG